MPAPKQPSNDLQRFDTILDRYYRTDPNAMVEKANGSVEAYNTWLGGEKGKLEKEQTRLVAQGEAMEKKSKEIEETDRALKQEEPKDRAGRQAVEAYNEKVRKRNEEVTKFNQRQTTLKQEGDKFSKAVEQFKAERATREAEVDKVQKQAKQWFGDWRHWRESKDDLAFFRDLNRTYAEFPRPAADRAEATSREQALAKFRAMRQELARWAAKDQEQDSNGLILLPVQIGGEECQLVVDTGASTVTVPPWLVEALGLTDRLGDPVEMAGVAGLHVQGRKLTLPRISVLGHEAQDVEAVVLPEPSVGLDGCLGQSFLNRFDWRIDRSKQPPLILEPKTGSNMK